MWMVASLKPSITEVIPGAVGGAPVVSPIVPASVDIGDRGYALKHRMGAWIAQMARGGGANFVDGNGVIILCG